MSNSEIKVCQLSNEAKKQIENLINTQTPAESLYDLCLIQNRILSYTHEDFLIDEELKSALAILGNFADFFKEI